MVLFKDQGLLLAIVAQRVRARRPPLRRITRAAHESQLSLSRTHTDAEGAAARDFLKCPIRCKTSHDIAFTSGDAHLHRIPCGAIRGRTLPQIHLRLRAPAPRGADRCVDIEPLAVTVAHTKLREPLCIFRIFHGVRVLVASDVVWGNLRKGETR